MSVSRIGSKAQIAPIKKLASVFKNQLIAYDEVKRFEVFDDVSFTIKQLIHKQLILLLERIVTAIKLINHYTQYI